MAEVDQRFDQCDVLIMTAALVDLRPANPASVKVKKESLSMMLKMEPVADILRTVAARKRPEQVVIGFAAETDHLEPYALRKLEQKNADYIAANLIGQPGGGFESDTNTLHVFARSGDRIVLGPALKEKIAAQLLQWVFGT